MGLSWSHDSGCEFYALAKMTRFFFSFFDSFLFQFHPSTLGWLGIGIYNFFICFLWIYLGLLTRVWQDNPGGLGSFFSSFFILSYFQFSPLTLGWFGNELYNLFLLAFYRIITVFLPRSQVKPVDLGFLFSFFSWFVFNLIL